MFEHHRRRQRLSIGIVLAITAASLGGCGPKELPEYATAPLVVRAAFVLLTEAPTREPIAIARVVFDPGPGCPDLVEVDGGDGARLSTSPRFNPHAFPVDVCEAVVPFGRRFRVADSAFVLPAASAKPSRVVVLGDTGCKAKDQEGCSSDDPSHWPFPAFARAAAQSPPDLVLHVGDYNYRGTAARFVGTVDGKPVEDQWVYDAGDGAAPSENCGIDGPYYSQNSEGSEDPDSWPAWNADFLAPAAPLLAAAPWVFARGNHELCSHAGPGWFFFLDSASSLIPGTEGERACPSQDGVDRPALPHLRFVPPATLRLVDLAVTVVDTANACDELPGYVLGYRSQFLNMVEGDTAGTRWLLMHRPIWGVDGKAKDGGYDCAGKLRSGAAAPLGVINRTLQCALEGETGGALLPEIDLVLAGHMHRFETMTFDPKAIPSRPPTLVVGNGGVELNDDLPTGTFAQRVDGVAASGFGISQYGYLELRRRNANEWSGEVVALDPGSWNGLLPACAGGAQVGGASPLEGLCVRGLPSAPVPPAQ